MGRVGVQGGLCHHAYCGFQPRGHADKHHQIHRSEWQGRYARLMYSEYLAIKRCEYQLSPLSFSTEILVNGGKPATVLAPKGAPKVTNHYKTRVP